MILTTNFCFGQTSDSLHLLFNRLLNNPKETTSFELKKDISHEQTIIEFEFGSDRIKNTKRLESLKKETILHVSYIYSAIKTSDSFDQEKLNRARLSSLHQLIPQAFKHDEWTTIVQTDTPSHNEALKYFHGFIIDFRKRTTSESTKQEINFIKTSLNQFKSPKTAQKPFRVPSTATIPMSTEDYYAYMKRLNEQSKQEPTASKINISYSRVFEDTTIIAVLERNNDWNNILIHCDLTASMSPYVAQLFVWFKMNIEKKKIKQFVFFNDGNKIADFRKVIGATGGIYYSNANHVNEVLKIAEECMRNTKGGDRQENDIEALIKGTNHFTDYDNTILIADNWANMRDYELMSQVNKPVHIILCGTSKGINPEYLDLARTTKGSIHTLELDVFELELINNGDELKIGEQVFMLLNDRFTEN